MCRGRSGPARVMLGEGGTFESYSGADPGGGPGGQDSLILGTLKLQKEGEKTLRD